MRLSVVRSCSAAALLALLAACSSQSSTAPKTTLQLTAPQAAALAQRLQQIGAANPAFGDLADSIAIGIQSGVGVTQIDLTTDLGTGPFYAFGLKRVFSGAPAFGPEFDILAFDNPSDPQNFILIDLFASSADAANGSFDGTSGSGATGVLFQLSGDSTLTWFPSHGVVSVAGQGPSGDCGSFQPPTGITCAQETMHIAFSVTSTTLSTGSGTGPTASFTGADLAGIVLTFSPSSPIQ